MGQKYIAERTSGRVLHYIPGSEHLVRFRKEISKIDGCGFI